MNTEQARTEATTLWLELLQARARLHRAVSAYHRQRPTGLSALPPEFVDALEAADDARAAWEHALEAAERLEREDGADR